MYTQRALSDGYSAEGHYFTQALLSRIVEGEDLAVRGKAFMDKLKAQTKAAKKQ